MKKSLVFIILISLISCRQSQKPELVIPVGHIGNINSICFSHDGKYVVTAGEDKTVKVWDIGRGKLLYDLLGHTDEVYSAAFDPEGEDLITVSRDNSIRRWNIRNGKEISCFVSQEMIDRSSISPDGHFIFTSELPEDPDSDFDMIGINEIKNNKSVQLSTIPGTDAFFAPNGKSFMFISPDGCLKKTKTRNVSSVVNLGKIDEKINYAEFSCDERFLSVITEDTLKIWNSVSGDLLLANRDTAYQFIGYCAFSSDGNWLAVAGLGKVNIYEVASGSIRKTIDLGTTRVSITSMIFSNDNEELLISTYGEGSLLWDVVNNKLLHYISGGSPAAFSPDGNYIAVSANYQIGYYSKEQDQVPKIFDAKTGKLLYRLEGHSKYISQAHFSKNGESVLTDSWDNSAICWDILNGKLVSKMKSDLLSFESVSHSPDNNYILTTAENETAILWEAATGKLLFSMKGDTVPKASYGRVFTAKISPDSKLIFTSYTSDSSVKIYDIQRRSLKYEFRCIPPITRVSFSNDGSLLAIVSEKSGTDVWDLNTGLIKYTLNNYVFSSLDSLLKYDSGLRSAQVTQALMTADGRYVITTINGATSEVWDCNGGKLLRTFSKNFNESVSPFLSDNRSFIASSYDSSFRAITSLVDITTGKTKFTYDISFDLGENNMSPDKNLIVIRNDDYLQILDLRTGKEVRKIQIPVDSMLVAFEDYRFSWDSRKIISGPSNGVIKIFDIETGKFENSKVVEFPPVNGDILSPNLRYFVNFNSYSPQRGAVEIWETNALKPVSALPWHLDEAENPLKVVTYVFSPDGSFIYTLSADGITKLWETTTGEVLKTFSKQQNPEVSGNNIIAGWELVNIFSNDGKQILAVSDNKTKIWDIQKGAWIPSFEPAFKSECTYKFLPGDNKLAALSDSSVKIWDIQSGKKIGTLTVHKSSIMFSGFSSDGTRLITTLSDGSTSFWNTTNGKLIYQFDTDIPEPEPEPVVYSDQRNAFESLLFSPDNRYIVTLRDLKIWNAVTGELLNTVSGSYSSSIQGLPDNPFSPDGRCLAASYSLYDPDDTVYNTRFITQIIDIESGEIKFSLDGLTDPPNSEYSNPFSPDGDNILTYSEEKKKYSLWNVHNGNKRFDLDWKDPVRKGSTAFFSPDGRYVITSSFESNELDYIIRRFPLDVWDTKTGKRINTIDLGSDYLKDINWDKNKILSLQNSKITITDIRTGDEIATFLAIDNDDYVFILPTGEYMGTPGAVKYLSWRLDNKLYDFEQWDLQYNRPDKVLQQLGNKDTALISMYRKAYLKRLKRAGFSENMFSSEMHTPEVKILNPEDFAVSVSDPQKVLKVNLTDSKYKLDRINIWINDVPLYGKNGFSLRKEKASSVVKNIPVTLSAGINKIQVSGLNEKGVESLKESVDIIYNPKTEIKPDLHVIAMSVSSYKDERYNLQYSVKDGRDMVSMFKSKMDEKGEFSKIFIDTLFNDNATKENFFSLREKLLKTDINDQVVVFLSGHGLLDRNMDFFYAPYDVDFDNPGKRGISFEEMEDLLDSIPARKKLLMMDACHSGEVDKEEKQELVAMNTQTSSDITFRGKVKEYNFKGVDNAISQSGTNLRSSFELMQELFSNLDKGTGTIVISAAAGKGYALESPQWNNGVFTYTILNGLKNKAADTNKDQNITISELKDYSIRKVEELTGGRQKPTARKESITFDWKVW